MLKDLSDNTLHIVDGNHESNELKQLFAHCAVHATHEEKEMWPRFARLHQTRCAMLFVLVCMYTLFALKALTHSLNTTQQTFHIMYLHAQ